MFTTNLKFLPRVIPSECPMSDVLIRTEEKRRKKKKKSKQN